MNPEIQKILLSILLSFTTFLGWGQNNTQIDIQKQFTSYKENNKPLSPISLPSYPEGKNDLGQNVKKTSNKNSSEINIKETKKQSVSPSELSSPIKAKKVQPASVAFLTTEENIKKSVANIYCIRPVSNGIEKITGSAVSIDPSGIYLTNAHVAIHIMLEEVKTFGKISCYLRTGSPAVKNYKLKVVYIPSTWVKNNSGILSKMNPTGNGEKDYAIVKTTDSISADAPNPPLPYLEESQNDPAQSENIYLAGYPAGFSDGNLLDSSLYEITQKVSVVNTYALGGKNSGEIFTSPTLLAERGSSGGAVVDNNGKLLGIMFATGLDPYSGRKNIQAISIPYIQNDLQNETGKILSWYRSNSEIESENFLSNNAKTLSNILYGQY